VTVAIWNVEVRSSESRKNEILAKTPFLKFGEFFLHEDINHVEEEETERPCPRAVT
jgi:hypothetical protein